MAKSILDYNKALTAGKGYDYLIDQNVVAGPKRGTNTAKKPASSSSQSSSSSPQQIIDDMNAGRIPWDDNLRAQANNALRGESISEDPVGSFLEPIINQYKKQAEEYTKKYSEFEKNNPFVFDKVLEEETAKVKQRLDPYYQQTLSDFLTGVNTKRTRSLEDERTLLSELNQDTDQFVGRQKNQLLDAIEQSREGKADAGLYSSGARLREQGKLETSADETLSDALTKQQRIQEQAKTATKRTGEDLTLAESQKRRDLTQEQTYQTQAQALPQVQQRQAQREFEKGQYTGAAPGVNPQQFQNSLYSFLGA